MLPCGDFPESQCQNAESKAERQVRDEIGPQPNEAEDRAADAGNPSKGKGASDVQSDSSPTISWSPRSETKATKRYGISLRASEHVPVRLSHSRQVRRSLATVSPSSR